MRELLTNLKARLEEARSSDHQVAYLFTSELEALIAHCEAHQNCRERESFGPSDVGGLPADFLGEHVP